MFRGLIEMFAGWLSPHLIIPFSVHPTDGLDEGSGSAAGEVDEITFELVADWFRCRAELVQKEEDNVGVTIKSNRPAGGYQLIQCVFNTKTETVLDGRVLKSMKMDEKMTHVHEHSELAVYR